MKKLFTLLSIAFIFVLCACNTNNQAQDNNNGNNDNNTSEPSNNDQTPKDDYKLSVVAPSGAPAVALTDLFDVADITVGIAADGLKTALTGKTSDVVIAPINLGANIYKANGCYKLAAVVTWGNLYLASQSPIDLTNVSGKNFVSFGKNTINDTIVSYCLNSKNVSFESEITYLSDTNETRDELAKNTNDIFLVAEPALSLVSTQLKAKGVTVYSVSVQTLYSEITGKNSYPQAGCFVNSTAIENHKTVVDEFINKLEASCNRANTATAEFATKAVELKIFANQAVLAKAIPNSNIRFTKAIDAKADIETVANLKLALFGGALPVNEFYYA